LHLSMHNINVTYGKHHIPALKNVSLTFKRGEFVGILGSSGAGKSSLIRCLNLLVRPTGGKIIWNDLELTQMPEEQMRIVRTNIGMIFQQFQLVPRLNVITNVLMGTLGSRSQWKNWTGYFSKEEMEAALRSLEQVGLDSFARQRVEHLSGGQQQRVAIARMILQKPKIILGDEPVASLDPVISRSIMDILKQLHEKNNLITILNLHDIVLAKQYATRIIGLTDGEVVFDGTPDEVTPEIEQKIYQGIVQKKIPVFK
jgi:phosphonate transport system ATP-binding protein